MSELSVSNVPMDCSGHNPGRINQGVAWSETSPLHGDWIYFLGAEKDLIDVYKIVSDVDSVDSHKLFLIAETSITRGHGFRFTYEIERGYKDMFFSPREGLDLKATMHCLEGAGGKTHKIHEH